MGTAADALSEIARLINSDEVRARAFCQSVQKHCQVLPSFASIAQALAQSDQDTISVAQVARLASQLHGTSPSDIEDEEEPETPQAEESSDNRVPHIDEALLPATSAFVEAITRHVMGSIFAASIEGVVIGFTGDGPYPQEALEGLAAKLKATPDREGIDWSELEWVVIGREGFDREYLSHSASFPDIEYLTQEAFLGLLLFGDVSSLKPHLGSLSLSHEGAKFVWALLREIESNGRAKCPKTGSNPDAATITVPQPDSVTLAPVPQPKPTAHAPPPLAPESRPSVTPPSPPKVAAPPPTAVLPSTPPKSTGTSATPESRTTLPSGWNKLGQPPRSTPATPLPKDFKWPDPTSAPGHEEHQGEPLDLREESDLKKLGYSVAKGVSLHDRRKILDYAVRNLGLRSVANHLAWLIRFHRNNPAKHDAVEHWEEDFEWLRSRYGSRY